MAKGRCPECGSLKIHWYKTQGTTKFWQCKTCHARWQTDPNWK